MRNALRRLLPAFLSALLVLALLPKVALALPAEADFLYTESGGEVTITGYKGPGGVVTIPSSIGGNPVVAIGSYAFQRCYTITKVMVPSSVKSIGMLAFWECLSISGITLSQGLQYIGTAAFVGCGGLTSITIPSTVTTIAEQGLECSTLETINVNTSNPVYSSLNGVLYNKARTILIAYPENKYGAFAVPNGVKRIERYAFCSVCNLTSISFPNTLTTIGSYAFQAACGMKTIPLSSSIKTIEPEAFRDVLNLESFSVAASNPYLCSINGVLYNKSKTTLIAVPMRKSGAFTMPSTVTKIEKAAFAGTAITAITLPSGLKTIGDEAFYSCPIAAITIPASVTSIGTDTFIFCIKLKSINVSASNASYCSVSGVLYNKNKTKLVCCPAAYSSTLTIPNGVTEIGYRAALGCTALKSVKLPATVTTIGYCAFIGCSNLTAVTLGSRLESIAEGAFKYCNLTEITIPAHVSFIDYAAFASNPSLKKAVFASAMPETVRYNAFSNNASGFKLYYPIAQFASWAAWTNTAKQAYCNAKMIPNNGTSAKPLMLNVNGGHVAAPAAIAWQGHRFTGWFKDAACTTPWNFASDVITGDITLYAGWDPPAKGGMTTVPPRVVWGK